MDIDIYLYIDGYSQQAMKHAKEDVKEVQSLGMKIQREKEMKK